MVYRERCRREQMELVADSHYFPCNGFFIDSVQVMYLLVTDDRLKVNMWCDKITKTDLQTFHYSPFL